MFFLQALSKRRTWLMGLAALWIFFFHEWTVTLDIMPITFLKRIGFAGVDVFFLLSGLGLTYAIGKRSLPAFYGKRLERLLFPFLAVAVFRGILEHWDMSRFLGNISGWNFFSQSMYSFLWFVPAIVVFYLLFPLYWYFFRRSPSPMIFWACSMGAWLLLSLLLRQVLRGDLWGFTNRIPVFLTGILLGWLLQNRIGEGTRRCTWETGLIGQLCLWSLVLVIGLILSWRTNYEGMFLLVPVSNCCIPNLLIALSGCMLVGGGLDALACLLEQHGLGRILSVLLSPLTLFGKISLEFYCIQEFLSQKLIQWWNLGALPPMAKNWILFAVCTAVAVLLHFVWHFILLGGRALIRTIKKPS